MRIIAGRHRGLRLAEVGAGDAAAGLRPTSDRTREAIFNILASMGDPVTGARVLDLFAGTGALGLEALSRGAAHVTLVDDGARAAALIGANIARLRADAAATLLRRDATRPGRAPHPCDLIFLDPPYGRALGERAIAAALTTGWIAPGAIVVWEEGAPPALPPPLQPIDARRYGDTCVTFARNP
jgi:16S rRNA (guanine966-N2)-methyltransferase